MNRTIFASGLSGLIALSLLTACSGKPLQPDVALEARQQHVSGDSQNQDLKQDLETGRRNAEVARRNSEATAEYHFALAQAYVAEGNPDRAIEEFKLTLMFDPNSPLVYARLATEYVKKGMLTDAMETCKEALQRDPNFLDARLMLAGLYSSAHELPAALAEYEKVLKIDPKHEEAAIYKSQTLSEAGKTIEAARFLNQFVKRNRDAALAWYYLGRAEQNIEHTKEAISAYRKAMSLRPGFAQAGLALGFLYEEKGMNAEAITIYRSIYEESQDLAAANRLATIYLKQEKYKEAIPFLQGIEATDPEDMNARVKLGLIYMETKDFEKAIASFKNILQKNPESDRVHYYLGSVYEEMKLYTEAINELRQVKPDSKLFSEAALHVAYLLKQSGSASSALQFISEAIAKAPNTSTFYIFQASLEEEQKNLDEAVSILERAVKKFPEDEKALYYLGSLYDRQGNTEKGLEQMEAILKLNPDYVDALNYIGYTWTQKGIRLGDAEKLLKRAIELKPDNGYIQDSWGWYLFVRGRLGEAVVALEKAARMKPNEPTILEHLGDVYLRKNLREKALSKYSDAVKYAEDDSMKKKIENKLLNLERELAKGEPSGSSDGKVASQPPSEETLSQDARRMPAGKRGK